MNDENRAEEEDEGKNIIGFTSVLSQLSDQIEKKFIMPMEMQSLENNNTLKSSFLRNPLTTILAADLFIPFKIILLFSTLPILSIFSFMAHFLFYSIEVILENFIYFTAELHIVTRIFFLFIGVLLLQKNKFQITGINIFIMLILVRILIFHPQLHIILDIGFFVILVALTYSDYSKNIEVNEIILIGFIQLIRVPLLFLIEFVDYIFATFGTYFKLSFILFIILLAIKYFFVKKICDSFEVFNMEKIKFRKKSFAAPIQTRRLSRGNSSVFNLMNNNLLDLNQKLSIYLIAGNYEEIKINWKISRKYFKFNLKKFKGFVESNNELSPDDYDIQFSWDNEDYLLTTKIKILKIGEYKLNLFYANAPIQISPFLIEVLPNRPSPKKSSLVVLGKFSSSWGQCKTQIYRINDQFTCGICLRDDYDNIIMAKAAFSTHSLLPIPHAQKTFSSSLLNFYGISDISQTVSIDVGIDLHSPQLGLEINYPETGAIYQTTSEDRSIKAEELYCEIKFFLRKTKIYNCNILFQNESIKNSSFDIIVLSPKQFEALPSAFDAHFKASLLTNDAKQVKGSFFFFFSFFSSNFYFLEGIGGIGIAYLIGYLPF